MGAAMLERMMLERASRREPWDRRPSGRPVSDVDEETLRAYVARGVERRRIPFAYTDARDVLSRLGLLCDDGTLSNAAAVCFCPSRVPMLRMGVLADSARTRILDNRQEAGTLFGLAEAAEAYILNNTRRAFVVDGSSLHREERPEIPASAVREALFNAFCHRRYEDPSAVQVDIFWDAVDIYSPGPFPSGLSPEDYLSGVETASKPRNQLIAGILYRSGDVETYGTGLRRIKDACDAQGVPVEVSERGSGVHVRFTRAEAVAAGGSPETRRKLAGNSPEKRARGADGRPLSGNELRVFEYLSTHGPASATEASEALGTPARTVRGVMRRLVEKGVVKAEGAGRGRFYSLR